MTDPLRVSPPKYYEVNQQVCTVDSAFLAPGAGLNQQMIAAVTGRRIRVMGFDLQGDTAAGVAVAFKNGSGGAQKTIAYSLPAIATGTIFVKPIVDCGYFETSTGVGLFVDTYTGFSRIGVYYITYAP